MTSAGPATDFEVQHHISIALLRPDTDGARVWCDQNLSTEGTLRWGRAFVIEPRFLEEILFAIVTDGLTVQLRG
jgi:hypothetical protein